jgi:O-antigen ligase
LLGYTVLQKGGVYPNELFPGLFFLAAVTVVAVALRRVPLAPTPPAILAALFAVAVTPVLQLIPLPASLVRALSPSRVLLDPGQGGHAMTLSVVPALTREWVPILLSCILVFLLARQLVIEFKQREWVVSYPLTAVAALMAILGTVQYYSGASETGASGTYMNRNHYAGLLEMCLPFPICLAISHWRKQPDKYHTALAPALKACGFLLIAAVILLGIIHSLSRMGFISTLVSLYVVGLVLLRGGPHVSRWRRALPVAAVGLLVAAAFVFLPPDKLISRFADMLNQTDGEASRSRIWADAVPMIRDFPVAGCGLGAFESCFHRYNRTAPNFRVDFAHNDYLQLLAELGLTGFLPLLFLAALALAVAVRSAVKRAQEDSGLLALACAGSLSAIAIHSIADFNLYIPANALALSWIGGIALRPRQS